MVIRPIPAAALIFLTLFVTGCSLFGPTTKPLSPTSPYLPLPNALDENYFRSPSGDIAARYPKGWLRVDIRSIPMENVLEVYTDPERERALVLAEIPATAEFRREVQRDGMSALTEQSFHLKSSRLPGKLSISRPTTLYTVKNKLFASYDYVENSPDSMHQRQHSVTLFTTGARFYELSMIELNVPRDPSVHVQNFRLLASVIASLEGAAEVRDTL
ncbi:MAG: hypothetical protein Q8922_13935 [Bacteroidota bacterium]|nr:hypothetical protein [Bacteroidota bacterium]MDP4232818.1 hypothetical protein [Bacteroidota bacterium]MDP4242501.1 hypothetical protein [Bacteroidota bacterium]MDP4289021.1 hypothetical protein [Bacteroidota bacterium]